MKNRFKKIKYRYDCGTVGIRYLDQYNFAVGLYRSFWKNGKFRKLGMFLNDKTHGIWKYYDDSEQIYGIDSYKNGWENGMIIEII